MPIAGPLAEDRAHAHYRWAARYHGYGDHKKAAVHFGRALDYSDEASFGEARRKRDEKKKSTKQWSGIKQGGVKKPDHVKKPDQRCEVCKTTLDLEWYRDTTHDKCFQLCGRCARDFLDAGDFIREPMCTYNVGMYDVFADDVLSKGIESMGVRDNSDNSDDHMLL